MAGFHQRGICFVRNNRHGDREPVLLLRLRDPAQHLRPAALGAVPARAARSESEESGEGVFWDPTVSTESAISRVEIIDVKSIAGDEIKFGATVEIEDDESGEISSYQIVGDYESDIKNKKLSVSSPLARGLINKTVEDVVEINSPKGQKSYTIKSIKYI